jgi:hypothetical protein
VCVCKRASGDGLRREGVYGASYTPQLARSAELHAPPNIVELRIQAVSWTDGARLEVAVRAQVADYAR